MAALEKVLPAAKNLRKTAHTTSSAKLPPHLMRITAVSCIMARTTVEIADPVLAELRRLQRLEGRSLGSLVSELLATALSGRAHAETEPPSLVWVSQPMGTPRIDIDDCDALYRVLDEASDAEGREPTVSSRAIDA